MKLVKEVDPLANMDEHGLIDCECKSCKNPAVIGIWAPDGEFQVCAGHAAEIVKGIIPVLAGYAADGIHNRIGHWQPS